MTIVHPIARAWISTGGTGARNYDEFADEAEITRIIAANPASALAVEMPHRAPDSLGRGFADALPAAASRLATAKRQGRYAPAGRVVVLYRIRPAGAAPGVPVMHGIFGMVDTDQISTSADEPGLVIRNEDVFPEKVRERVALAEATGHLLSPVLLVRSDGGGDLPAALEEAVGQAGVPAVADTDHAGRVHEIWPVPPGPTADRLCGLGGAAELVVADGNHRTLAAQAGGLSRFLAVVTAPGSVSIDPYNRLISELPDNPLRSGHGLPGLHATPVDRVPELPPPPGVTYLYTAGRFVRVELPADPGAAPVDNLDHARVEHLLIRGAFDLDPGDKRVGYVGGDYPPSWLCGEVDAGRAELAIFIAPVSVDDFVAVNLARQKLPRKSTWFTPKARAGLVLAQLP
jgi:uncharacterized protein (DUF1015 family)